MENCEFCKSPLYNKIEKYTPIYGSPYDITTVYCSNLECGHSYLPASEDQRIELKEKEELKKRYDTVLIDHEKLYAKYTLLLKENTKILAENQYLTQSNKSYNEQFLKDKELKHQLEGAIKAQDEREIKAGLKCGVDYHSHGCDWPDFVADMILYLKKENKRLELELHYEQTGEI